MVNERIVNALISTIEMIEAKIFTIEFLIKEFPLYRNIGQREEYIKKLKANKAEIYTFLADEYQNINQEQIIKDFNINFK